MLHSNAKAPTHRPISLSNFHSESQNCDSTLIKMPKLPYYIKKILDCVIKIASIIAKIKKTNRFHTTQPRNIQIFLTHWRTRVRSRIDRPRPICAFPVSARYYYFVYGGEIQQKKREKNTNVYGHTPTNPSPSRGECSSRTARCLHTYRSGISRAFTYP